jgi:hypothetical protein
MNPLHGVTRPSRGRSVELTNPAPHGTPGITNRVRLAVKGPDGTIKQVGAWCYNIMNTFGLASLASRVGTVSGANVNTTTELVSAMKIGTGTTAATSTDASLYNSTGSLAITQGAGNFTKSNLGNMTVEYQATFSSNNPAGAASITEVGLFCNSTADSQLFARAVLTGAQSVNKGASDTIQISYDTIYKTA